MVLMTPSSIYRLRVCHNDILKRLLGVRRWFSSSETFVSNNIKCLDVVRRHSVSSLKLRAEQSWNTVVTTIRQSSAYTRGAMRQKWLHLLMAHHDDELSCMIHIDAAKLHFPYGSTCIWYVWVCVYVCVHLLVCTSFFFFSVCVSRYTGLSVMY
ncbi:hypothetical protein E2C01_087686 [Portunus trituberculatus]|uniref:Uncharacterized protein n=1 Tax=Portunus trituberculatus TaxID=210409 RepID=A0A5B7JCB2_PORTR|nr:hypothetical protein [Portunus trituberculatus]